MQDRIRELERKIEVLTKQDVPEATIKKYREELVELHGTTVGKPTEIQTGGDKPNMTIGAGFGDEGFSLDVTPEEFEKAGSKFATPGLHLSEMGMPEWDNIGVSLKFPFTIVEEGADNGKESKISCGVKKEALWKLKELLTAVGVAVKTTAEGKVSFDHMAVVGKQCMILWTKQKDSRTVEEGGTGTEYTKAESAYPVGTKEEDLGI